MATIIRKSITFPVNSKGILWSQREMRFAAEMHREGGHNFDWNFQIEKAGLFKRDLMTITAWGDIDEVSLDVALEMASERGIWHGPRLVGGY